jgi:predicted RND superfamily exporter protein
MHQKLERLMERFGLFIYHNPIKILFMVAILLALPLSHLPRITMDTSTEGFMHDDDPVLITYNEFREEFGRDERIALVIKSDTIFTLPFLQTLKELHEEIESTVPHLEDVTSLYNVRNTRGEGDTLLTDDLLDPMPTTQAEVEAIKTRALASEFYKNLLINPSATMTGITIETNAYTTQTDQSAEESLSDGFDEESDTKSVPETLAFLTDVENKEIVQKLIGIVKKYQEKGLDIYLAGSPVINDALKSQMSADMQQFTRITFLVIILFLFLMFRRVSAVFYPLLVIILSLLTTVGSMAFAGVPFKLPTQIVPSLLLAVSVGATVHILSIFFDKFNAIGDKKEALRYTMGHSGLAIAMTSVTTAIGIGSFAGSEVAPIADLGYFASLGVLVSLFLTLTLLPALLTLTKLKPKPKATKGRLDNIMKAFAVVPVRYYKQVIAGSFILIATALYLSSKIELSHNPLYWFQEDNFNRISTEVIDKELEGSVTIEVLIDSQKVDGWKDPQKLETLNKLSHDLEQYVDEFTHIGKVISLATIVKETNQALHSNDASHYTIPTDKALVAQELLLFENSGSDDLEDVVDTQFSKARITIKLPWTDAVKATGVVDAITQMVAERFPNETAVTTGMIPLLINTFANAVSSSAKSYMIAFVAISFMMMLILASVRLGLLSMIPNLTPIILGLLIMYSVPIPLDMFTLLIGSIAIGLAVDDTIHFTHNFRRYYLQSGDTTYAIEQTFFTTGKAMLITTIVLSLGFYAYLFGEMISVQNFGLLTGSVIILALLADLLLAPALMIVVAKRGWIK